MAHVAPRLQADFREIIAPGRFNQGLALGDFQIEPFDLGIGLERFLPQGVDLAGRNKVLGELAADIHLHLFLQPQGAGQDFPGQAHGVLGFHDRLLRLGDLGLGSE